MSDRLFFAFWPDDALRRNISGRLPDWLHALSCRPQRPDQWHLTVEFLGNVDAARQPALLELGASLAGGWPEPADVVLDRLEHWPKPQVLCVTALDVPPPVRALVAGVKAGLAARRFEPERRDFRPHLTLARKVRERVESRSVEPLRWPVRELVLVRSVADAVGSRYEPLAVWNLVQTKSGQMY